MMIFLADLFRDPLKVPPSVGEVRVLFSDVEGPWGPKANARYVEVLDVQEGWVRYKWLDGSKFVQDERDTVRAFNMSWLVESKPKGPK